MDSIQNNTVRDIIKTDKSPEKGKGQDQGCTSSEKDKFSDVLGKVENSSQTKTVATDSLPKVRFP